MFKAQMQAVMSFQSTATFRKSWNEILNAVQTALIANSCSSRWQPDQPHGIAMQLHAIEFGHHAADLIPRRSVVAYNISQNQQQRNHAIPHKHLAVPQQAVYPSTQSQSWCVYIEARMHGSSFRDCHHVLHASCRSLQLMHVVRWSHRIAFWVCSIAC